MIDVFIESLYGRNILGFGEPYGERIVSFFKDEPIVGGYLNGFYLIIIGYLFYLNKDFLNRYKNIILIVSIFLRFIYKKIPSKKFARDPPGRFHPYS